MSDLTFDDIRARFACTEVAEDVCDMALDRAGKVLCWLHEENSPSMQLYDDHYFCFGCGASGDVLALISTYYGCSLGRAKRLLVDGFDAEDRKPRVHRKVERTGLDVAGWMEEFAAHSLSVPAEFDWLKATMYAAGVRRQLTGVDILVVPHDEGIKLRFSDGGKRSVPGSRFKHVYAPFGVSPHIILFEGESDVWAWEAKRNGRPTWAWPSPVGMPSGVNSWNAEMWEGCSPGLVHRFYVCFDNDAPGRAGVLEAQHHTPGGIGYSAIQVPAEWKDAREALTAGWEPRL